MIREYKEYLDQEIGQPYYFHEPEEVWCKKFYCNDIENGYVEYTPQKNKDESCVITWVVNAKRKGEYAHPNGHTFTIAGFKHSWRYVSKPSLCLLEVGSIFGLY